VSDFYLLCKGDSLGWQFAHKFSTRDQDNDLWAGSSCAVARKGAWWFSRCTYSHLNGLYYRSGNYKSSEWDGIEWQHWKGDKYSMRFTEMKIRPFGA